jgi:hypothetical protein
MEGHRARVATTDLPDKQSVARFGSGVAFISTRRRAKSTARKNEFFQSIQPAGTIAPIAMKILLPFFRNL